MVVNIVVIINFGVCKYIFLEFLIYEKSLFNSLIFIFSKNM